MAAELERGAGAADPHDEVVTAGDREAPSLAAACASSRGRTSRSFCSAAAGRGAALRGLGDQTSATSRCSSGPVRVATLVSASAAALRARRRQYELRDHVRALREAQARAERACDRRKDEFLAMLAHELRNPLAPIRNAVAAASKLRDGRRDPSSSARST